MFENTRAFSGFSVDDVLRAKAFYADILGLCGHCCPTSPR
ncbi:MAG: VOC family protein [Nocardioidaceae bacterium]